MPDREKIIAQCEWAIKQTSPTIIESKTFYEEVLALLKEQENEKKRNPVIVCPHCGKRVK